MEYKELNKICTILNGYAFKSEKYSDEGYRVIRITNVQKGLIVDDDPKFYSFEDMKDLKRYELFENDLLMSLTGNVGRVGIIDQNMLPAALNQRVACLRLKDKSVNLKYLFYWLNSDKFEKTCISNSNGIAQKNLSTEFLKSVPIPIHPLETQKKIVEALDKAQVLIDARKEQIRLMDELVKSQFIEMFGDPVQNPMRWETKRLSELGNCKNGMNFSADEQGVELKYLGVGDFKNHSKIEDVKELGTVSLNQAPSDEYLLQNGDIVFVRSNGNKALVGRSLAVYPNGTPTTFSGFCIRFRKNNKSIEIPYLLQVLRSNSMRMLMCGRGANIQNLNQQILGNLIIPIPPISLQLQYSEFMKKTEINRLEMQYSLDAITIVYQSLMQQYFE